MFSNAFRVKMNALISNNVFVVVMKVFLKKKINQDIIQYI